MSRSFWLVWKNLSGFSRKHWKQIFSSRQKSETFQTNCNRSPGGIQTNYFLFDIQENFTVRFGICFPQKWLNRSIHGTFLSSQKTQFYCRTWHMTLTKITWHPFVAEIVSSKARLVHYSPKTFLVFRVDEGVAKSCLQLPDFCLVQTINAGFFYRLFELQKPNPWEDRLLFNPQLLTSIFLTPLRLDMCRCSLLTLLLSLLLHSR